MGSVCCGALSSLRRINESRWKKLFFFFFLACGSVAETKICVVFSNKEMPACHAAQGRGLFTVPGSFQMRVKPPITWPESPVQGTAAFRPSMALHLLTQPLLSKLVFR